VEVPVSRVSGLRRRLAELAAGLDERTCLDPVAALGALVPPGLLEVTLGTAALEVPVRQEHLVLRTVGLGVGLLREQALLVQVGEELLAELVVGGERGPTEVVELDLHVIEDPLDLPVPVEGEVLRGLLRPGGVGGDRGAVLVGAADVEHLVADRPAVPHVDVGRQVGAGHVPEVDRAVGVGQR
jgi:hypothetical protein